MTMNRTLALAALSTLAASCYGGGAEDDSIDTDTSEVTQGTVATPWAASTSPTPQRAIVSIGGCTGTVVAPRWVLSAKHCGFTVGRQVTSVRPTGNITRTVDRVVAHPTIDGVMLHLATAFTDIPAVTLGSGTTASLIGQSVTCYGYGARSAVAPVNGQCPSSAWWIPTDSNVCLLSDSSLRFGSNTTRANATVGYFETFMNVAGQMTVPGDSGGPCFRGSSLVGINSAWYFNLSGSIHVSVPEVRRWIDRVLRPSVRADYDGDGRTDLSVYRPSNSTFYVINSASGAATARVLGASTDRPVLGDYDGDGRTDAAVWRPATGLWSIVLSATGVTYSPTFGVSSDVPVPGDYDGDGRTDIAVYRPAQSRWYYVQSSDGTMRSPWWGFDATASGDVAVPGDYDGDRRSDLAVWRPSTGVWRILQSSNGAIREQQWGDPADVTVAADYDGDDLRDIAVWRPSVGTWYIRSSATNSTYWQGYGQAGDSVPRGDYNGDGRADVAAYRGAGGIWSIWLTSGSAYTQQWGQFGDISLPTLTF
jgi:hypothetical protein